MSILTKFDPYYRIPENKAVEALLNSVTFTSSEQKTIHDSAFALVEKIRETRQKQSGIESFLSAYGLSTEEGIALMCIAEAMLRIPDAETKDKLIKDKFSQTHFVPKVGDNPSLFVNVASFALMLTGKVLSPTDPSHRSLPSIAKKLVQRFSEPVIRFAVAKAMEILGEQFVKGKTISNALTHAQIERAQGYTHSFDMLGESARTMRDAEKYFDAYKNAIEVVGRYHSTTPSAFGSHPSSGGELLMTNSGISIKLSALYPRYEIAKIEEALPFLVERLVELVRLAKTYSIGITIDAEETSRLAISLAIMEQVFDHPELANFEGFGLALQAYQKRAFYVIDWLIEKAKAKNKRWMLRLVKGAYWDSEIKRCQEGGFLDYPVFTRKVNTDVSYLACAKKILAHPEAFYAQFATHNPHTLATILTWAGNRNDYEFQCLHGMGQNMYDHLMGENFRCRIYSPVGSYEDLLPYLVRRLLENGANTSFVNQIMDARLSIETIIADPFAKAQKSVNKQHPNIPLPSQIFLPERQNSQGLDMSSMSQQLELNKTFESLSSKDFTAYPLIDMDPRLRGGDEIIEAYSPNNKHKLVGKVLFTTPTDLQKALDQAEKAFPAWDETAVDSRATCLENIAALFEKHRDTLLYLAVSEAGKTISDAIAEVREAVDFCYYYAMEARKLQTEPLLLKGATGEYNALSLKGRGIVACISPWNFPLAIFTGQVVAALVTGNTVIAKPAEQTSLIAFYATKLFYEAGIPQGVFQLLPGSGEVIGASLVKDERIKAVIFTGSTVVAKSIAYTLSTRKGAIVPLIAETGGQNAMIVDSSALPEQVVDDVVSSAFGSAGQRCSALRVLYLQEDIAERVITLLKGAMQTLRVGDSSMISTDVGPVIDHEAKEALQKHIDHFKRTQKVIAEVSLGDDTEHGSFVAPIAFEIKDITVLEKEVFGPVLHVIRFALEDLPKVVDDINATGYGLTLGIHSRINERIEWLSKQLRVGNIYVNRNIIGAVVGVQPFGGEGLSGTGPKAGGPHYLPRLCVERTLTINTTATGGNASLLALTE